MDFRSETGDGSHPSEFQMEVLATTLVGLGIATAFLGCSLWILGRLKLATMVQYLPMPVVGQYVICDFYNTGLSLSEDGGDTGASVGVWEQHESGLLSFAVICHALCTSVMALPCARERAECCSSFTYFPRPTVDLNVSAHCSV